MVKLIHIMYQRLIIINLLYMENQVIFIGYYMVREMK